jgi:type I restriction enzyme S subunit
MRTEDTLPDGWTSTTSGELFTYITSGSRGWAKYYAAEGAKFIRVGNLSHYTTHLDLDDIQHVRPPGGPEARRTLTQAGDLLVSITADVGMVGLVPDGLGEAYVNQHVAIARPTPEIDNRYLAWFLLSESGGQRQLKALQRGVTKAGLGLDDLKAVEVPVPPRQEQGRIVEKVEELLSDLDAGVSGLARARANLKRYRAAVLKAAVTGELTAEWRAAHPNVEPATKLFDRILAERRRKWEVEQGAKLVAPGKKPSKGGRDKYHGPCVPDTSDLPTLPSEWCWATMDMLVRQKPQNGAYYPQTMYGMGTPILRIDDYQNFSSRSSAELQRVNCPDSDMACYSVQTGDILINRVNSPTHLGKCLLIEKRHTPAVYESNMMRLRLQDGVVGGYVRDYLRSIQGRRRLVANAKWAVNQASINQQDVLAVPVPLPPLPEQEAIVAEVEQRLSVIAATEDYIAGSLKRGARLRQSILKEAFSGRLVPQDPPDEPASVLLDQIRQVRPSAAPRKRRQPDLFE